MYGLSNGENIFDLTWPLKVKGQPLEAIKWYKFFGPQMTFRGQRSRSNPKNFEVEYLEYGTR